MKSIQNIQTKDLVVQILREQILSGDLKPGEELELCFYGITDRRGKTGRRWKKGPVLWDLAEVIYSLPS